MEFAEALEVISQTFVANSIRRDTAACAAAYSEDVEYVFSMSRSLKGRDALRKAFDELPPVTFLETLWQDSSGDMGCCIQRGECGGDFHVMLVFRKQQDGSLEVIREVDLIV
mgnify:CR=1 FL=1